VGVSDVYSKSLLNADIQTIQTSLVVPLSPHYPSDIVLLGSFVEGNRVGDLVIKGEEEQGEKGLVKKKNHL